MCRDSLVTTVWGYDEWEGMGEVKYVGLRSLSGRNV